MLTLEVFEFNEVEGVFFLYLLEALPHLVYLFIQVLVVLLYMK